MRKFIPDRITTESVLSGRLSYADLDDGHKRWVVMELTQRGYGATMIAELLGCSIRQVKRLRAERETRVMVALWEAEAEIMELTDKNRRLAARCRDLQKQR